MERRREKPFKGKWFLPGGRIQYGETMIEAVKRQAAEIGISAVESIDFLCVSETVNPPGPTGVKQHSIWHVFVVKVAEYAEPEDEETIKWFHTIDARWPKAPVSMLQKIGFSLPKAD
jgi:ADP-ribose pyrophosphatase YjhB (NUDIX family)